MYHRHSFARFEEIEEALRKEKTVLGGFLDEDSLVKLLCPQKPEESDLLNHELNLRIIQKFMKFVGEKVKSNQYSIVFDESRTRNGGHSHLVLDDDVLEVLLPLRRPQNSSLWQITPGYYSVNMQAKEKNQKISNEAFEGIWVHNGTEWILSSGKVCQVMYAILQDVVQSLGDSMRDYLTVANLRVDCSDNVILGELEFNKEYLNTKSHEKPQKVYDTDEEDDLSSSSSPRYARAAMSRRSIFRESLKGTYDIRIRVRIIPAITINVKEKLYLVSQRPNKESSKAESDHLMGHSWFQDCWWREQTVLDKISIADKSFRLSTIVALGRICGHDRDLEFLTLMHLKHNLLFLVDRSVDNTACCWQRRSLYQCFYDQLECLHQQLQSKKIVNYFNVDNNLLDRSLIDNGTVFRGVHRLSMLLKSRSSLIRCIKEAI